MTPAPVVVRPADSQDLDRLGVLFDAYRQFYGAGSDVDAARGFVAERMARGESEVLVAVAPDSDGLAAGFAQLFPSFTSLGLRPILILNDLFVDPTWRRIGAARALVEAAVELAVKSGASRLELSTQHGNLAALSLYRSLGWIVDREFTHLSFALDGTPRSA